MQYDMINQVRDKSVTDCRQKWEVSPTECGVLDAARLHDPVAPPVSSAAAVSHNQHWLQTTWQTAARVCS